MLLPNPALKCFEMFGDLLGPLLTLIGAAIGLFILLVLPCWKICVRIGLPGWFGLVVLVPYIGLTFLLYIVAFTEWQIPKESARRNREGAGKVAPPKRRIT